jgi:hypothetical protein
MVLLRLLAKWTDQFVLEVIEPPDGKGGPRQVDQSATAPARKS